jgi:eukaryotic-like serine/threonine-protein kinase
MSLHQRAKDIFIAALEHSSADRAAFLADACGGDPSLYAEVESLLAFHDEEEEAPTAVATADAETREAGSPTPAPAPDFAIASGDVFARRYRMITRLGRGGMGEVWRADDLVLQTAVALKLIDARSQQARERILNEVRLARQITHPAVCRVFDVGETEGGVAFYSMELVQGEDLAALLRRVGRLPSPKVVDIARQLCSGLAAAHDQGVLHRDLKPANILIDNQGFVRITDFGIAIPRDSAGRHRLTGTPGYMAPEQLERGSSLTERTDVYALGLVLYEILVGRHPFPPGRTEAPPLPSSLVPHVDSQLERLVMQAISADPLSRPESAVDMLARLPGTGRGFSTPTTQAVQRRLSHRAWIAGAAAIVLAGIVAVASSYFIDRGAVALTAQDTIVLADFENTTGDPIFDGTLKVALAVALEQSPFVKVFPDDRARETLRLMQRPPDTRITRSIARDIARREQLKALIAGSVASLGRNYVITLEALNADTGDVMAREQVEAAGKEEVLTSLGGATSRIRQKLGESLASVRAFDVPLARATTASLDALHAYSLALSEGSEVPRLEAIPHLQRAIELDPDFAMAYAFLSSVYANTGQSSLAPAQARKAFELRDRVSERERFFISWRYYRDAVQAWDKALDLARSWTATYPREAGAFNSLGVAHIRLGHFADSVTAFREAIRLDPKFTPSYGNLSAALLALDRYDDARAVLRQAAERKLDFIGARRLSYLLAFVQGDTATMERELTQSVGPRETNSAFGWQAHTSAFGGHAAAAHEQFRLGIRLALQGNFTEVAAQLTVEDAETHALMGECGVAREEIASGLELSRDNATLERASRALALCGAAAQATALTAEVAKRFPEATLTMRMTLPITAAIVATSRGQHAEAVQMLEAVRPYDHAPSAEFWPAYLRGRALLQMRDGRNAATNFRSIIDHRGEVPASVLYPLAHLGLAQASIMTSDLTTARQAYQSFFELWKDADSGLTPLKQARAEYARLDASRDAVNTASR